MKTAIILIARAGAGKGTQAEFLREHFGKDKTLYLYAGDILRELARKPDSLSGKYMQEKVMARGDKAPDFSAIWAWADAMIHQFHEGIEAVIVDGSPRTRLEALILDEALLFYEIENVKPLFFEITREEAFKRLLGRNRSDDTPENIEHRFAYYERVVTPAIEYYKTESRHKLITIDAMLSSEKVFEQIKQAI